MENIIRKYQLLPHPEGGYYREVHRSEQQIKSHGAKPGACFRNTVTHIYFLLCKDQISRFHRVSHDEIWNFYEGAPLELIQFSAFGKDNGKIHSKTIGPGCRDYMAVVPGNTWQAAKTRGDYSFLGCTVAPGFDFKDFSFLRDTPKDLALFNRLEHGYQNFL